MIYFFTMKKSERQAKHKDRVELLKDYELQEKTVQSFVDECKLCMTPDDWTRYYVEAKQSAGESFHIFDYLISALASTQLKINPQLRTAIDAVLEAYDIDRKVIENLQELNYDRYWKERYGYS